MNAPATAASPAAGGLAANAVWRSLRVRLAALGFLAIYVPALLLFGVILATDTEATAHAVAGMPETRSTHAHRSAWATRTILALGPAAAGLAWWWAGRAVRPIGRVHRVAEDVQGTDLGLRIGLDRGPAEVVALAASFDAMLDRLEAAAETQRRLIEETSHELRTPLSVLVANTEVLLAHPDPTVEVYRQGLERSRRAADRLQTTLDDLLVEARGRARTIDRRQADLMDIVRAVLHDARPPAGDVELSLTGPRSATCPVDEPTVRRAVANLVHNAVKYAPAGSVVEVAVATTASEASVTVTDHGPGIPPDQQHHVFQRFWRGRPDTPGTGLGLPIAAQIAAAHGGTLTLASPGPTGDGCAFRLTLRR
ncbi:HAMP domain-containing sensor histidine kinase [Sphaerisporangium sp. TRM90804]|uniref:HAMP domain-containing sensor histidine kinase n=1 Tax=Sphaerisporangium sp. TRM90804 TaxID=3031113 RepID=UPI0024493EDD|nr:HAMP domain-containing sensor histidine kinase [Sphaerisporangium sp. TRM90804]MDH2428303.1 HAMP domain-containing sensor histidine kinase [Sphaerisporangium sp. TRM90804]